MKLRNKYTGLVGEMVIMGNDEIGVSCVASTYSYDSLSEFLSEGWEDYKPLEPLIKDENTRKAVKAWAYINSVETVTYDEIAHDGGLNVFFFEDNAKENVIIQFYGWIPTLEEGEIHTIAELCGDEE